MAKAITGQQFAEYLVTQEPVYDREIIKDVRPMSGEIGHVSTGVWDPFSSVSHTFDRFNSVFPDLTKKWMATPEGSCVGTPCDYKENHIGMGNTRVTYSMEQISWASDLICFDQVIPLTRAKESLAYFISDILRPTTEWVTGDFIKKRAADLAGKKWLANSTVSDFTFSWETTGDAEIYINTSGTPTSKLTPQMLRRRFNPLVAVGYFGGGRIGDGMPQWAELVTDNDTLYDMVEGDSAILRSNGDLASTQWRFQEFTNVGEFWKYGWSGKIGNFATRIDPFPLRFNLVGTNRFQRVLPYKNVAATNGLKSVYNTDYDNAQYQFSRIHHREGMMLMTARMESVNPQMPYAVRDLGGKWQFVMDNLGVDSTGNVIENKRRNKGQFIADFKLAAKPVHTEWLELIFHKREPACVITVATCNASPGSPGQSYGSANSECDPSTTSVEFLPVLKAGSGFYSILANTITCDGVPIVHAAITGSTTLALLVTEMTSKVSSLGTWSAGSNGNLVLTGTSCGFVNLPFVP